jgi:integrase
MVTETIKLLMDDHNSLDASLHDLRFLTVVVLCFAGFMRIDELLATKLKHITIKDHHMEIFLAESKTDKTGEGNTIFIPQDNIWFVPLI